MIGYCSKCHKVWTLETRQGVCQWCGKPATCQDQRTQALRSLKSRSSGRKRQAGLVAEIEAEAEQSYNRLDGE
jgi:hypothetical protein